MKKTLSALVLLSMFNAFPCWAESKDDGTEEQTLLQNLTIGYLATSSATINVTGGSRVFLKSAPLWVFGVDANIFVTPSPGSSYTIGADALFGADKRFSSITLGGTVGLGFLLNNGISTAASWTGSVLTIPFQADFGIPVGKGVRLGINLGYRWTPTQPSFSAFMVGLRLGMKHHQKTTPVED